MLPPLCSREEESRPDLCRRLPILCVLSNTDNFETRSVLCIEVAKMFSEGVSLFEKTLGEGLVDDGDPICSGRVLLGDSPPLQDFCADAFKVSITDPHPRGIVLVRIRWRQRLSFQVNRFSPVIALHWRVKGNADLSHTRNRSEIVAELLVKG